MNVKRTSYTAALLDSDLAAAEAAMSAVSGRFEGLFSIPLIGINDPDPDLNDPDAILAAATAWGTVVTLKPDESRVLGAALSGIASLRFQEIERKKPKQDEEQLNAFANTYDFRVPGESIEAYATGIANGSQPAQSTTSTYSLVDQWTSTTKLVQVAVQGQRFKIMHDGNYQATVEILYEPVENVTFTATISVNAGTVVQEVSSSNGFLKGAVSGNVSVDDLIGVAIKSDVNASFQMIQGRYRLNKIS